MRQLLILFLALGLFCSPVNTWAQNDDASVFVVTDVATDVTASNSAHARDQAIAEAQRTAFGQLLERLGADSSLADNLRNDDIATLVQNFEVQNEHVSHIRYLGTFTVQFKPNAVRNLLGGHNTKYTEAQSKPVLVIAISNSTDHPILWEEATKWRAAWDASPRKSGLVPVILPTGDLGDITALGTEDAVAGKADAIKSMIDKYQAGGAIITTLSGDPDKAGSDLTIDVLRYDADGAAHAPMHLTMHVPNDKILSNNIYAQGVKLVRAQLEKSWRDDTHTGNSPQTTAMQPSAAALHLLVTVPVPTLAEWAQIRRKLDTIPNINHVNVITLARESTSIELEFHGALQDLQTTLSQQGLSLAQSGPGGAWELQTLLSGNPL